SPPAERPAPGRTGAPGPASAARPVLVRRRFEVHPAVAATAGRRLRLGPAPGSGRVVGEGRRRVLVGEVRVLVGRVRPVGACGPFLLVVVLAVHRDLPGRARRQPRALRVCRRFSLSMASTSWFLLILDRPSTPSFFAV